MHVLFHLKFLEFFVSSWMSKMTFYLQGEAQTLAVKLVHRVGNHEGQGLRAEEQDLQGAAERIG